MEVDTDQGHRGRSPAMVKHELDSWTMELKSECSEMIRGIVVQRFSPNGVISRSEG